MSSDRTCIDATPTHHEVVLHALTASLNFSLEANARLTQAWPGKMSKQAKYLFVSVPSSITPSGHKDDAIQSLQSAVNQSYGTVNTLNIPEFKVGTLDALLQMSEELQRLEGQCQGVVSKVGDTLKNILDGDEEKMAQHKAVNDSMWHSSLSM
jgi:hypothetical protein